MFGWVKYIFLFNFLILTTWVNAGEPTVQPTNITVTNSNCTDVTITWTNGDGAWRLMIIKEASAVTAAPSDGTKGYTASSTFGLGTNLGSGNYICFNNITNSVKITGLKQNTTYHIALFEHDNLNPDYLTTSPATASFTTENIDFKAYFTYKDSCQRKNSYVFHNRTTATFGPLDYQWNLGDGTKVKADSVIYSYDTGGVFTITLSVINARGCINVFTLPKKLVCYSQPKSKIAEINNDTVQCLAGNLFKLNNLSTIDNIPNTALLGQWRFPNGDTNSNKIVNLSFTDAGYKKIKLINETFFFTTRTGCIDSLEFILNVVNNPGNDVVINDTVQCFKNNLFNFTNKSASFSFGKWYFGDGDSSNNKTVNHQYGALGTYPVIHIAETVEGCKSRDTFPIVVKANKNAQFTTTKNEYCFDEAPIDLTATDTNGTFYALGVLKNKFTPLDTGTIAITHIVYDNVCPDTHTKAIRIKPLPYFNLRDTTICNSGTVTYTVNEGDNVLWEDGSTNRIRSFNQTGTYTATSFLEGCSYSNSFDMYVGTAPILNFPSDTTLCKDQILNLTVNASPGTQFNWSNGSRSNTITISSPQILNLVASNGCGTSSASIAINYLLENCDLFIPNAFTPNQNGKNELFNLVKRNALDVEKFVIYNRWGNIVYIQNDKNTEGWDGQYNGKPAVEGVYIYNIIYTTGVEPNISQNTIKGVFHLMR